MRVISFDVFDTVLTRTCAEPRDLFLLIGERVLAAGVSAVTAPRFAIARRQAERDARRRTPKREVVLDDIYLALAARLGWDAAQRDSAKAVELAVEAENIRPVPAMRVEVKQARSAADRVIFISDMYLPSTVVRRWLEQADFWQAGDLLYISGEAGVCKATGELFEKIRTELNADFGTWVHHGDHPVSDLAQPHRLGIAANHQAAARLTPREKLLRGDATFSPGWRSLLAGASRLARLDQPAEEDGSRQRVLWETGASVAGPLFYGFTGWCLAEAEQRGIGDLFFLARGGQIFLRLAREIQTARPGKTRLHYLPVSRLALIGTADLSDPARLRALAAPRLVFHSARQACINLGLTVEDWPAPPWLPAAEWERNLTISERERLADWLLDPVRFPRVQAALRERQRRARAWLGQQGLDPQARIGLVDTGWMGTIQHNLEYALGEGSKPVAVTGFYLGRSRSREFTCAGPVLAYTATLSRPPLQRVQTPRVLLELMARADHGPVVNYAGEGAAPLAPQYGPLEAATMEDIRFFQDAVLAFARHALDAGPTLVAAPPAALADAVANNYAEFHGRPTPAEVLVFGRIPHADQLLEQHHAVLCPAMRLDEVLTAMLDWRRRPPCWWLAGQARLGHAPLLHFYMALKNAKWWLQSAFAGPSD